MAALLHPRASKFARFKPFLPSLPVRQIQPNFGKLRGFGLTGEGSGDPIAQEEPWALRDDAEGVSSGWLALGAAFLGVRRGSVPFVAPQDLKPRRGGLSAPHPAAGRGVPVETVVLGNIGWVWENPGRICAFLQQFLFWQLWGGCHLVPIYAPSFKIERPSFIRSRNTK